MITVSALGSLYVYRGILLGAHDGDTVKLRIDRGFGDFKEALFRLEGCNANERDDPGGIEALSNIVRELNSVPFFYVGSRKPNQPLAPYKYGAVWMCRIVLPDGVDLIEKLIEQNWLARWDGRGEKPKPPWPRPD